MVENSNRENPTPDSPQAFEDLNIVLNGRTVNNQSEIPPEVSQKLEEAFTKLRQNPGLFNMIGGLAGLAKTANQLGITRLPPNLAKIINSSAEAKIDSSPASANIEMPSSPAGLNNSPQTEANIHQASPETYSRLNRQRNLSPTFNPAVKGDGLRKFLFVVIMCGLIGYLIFQYGFQGKLPF